MAEQRINRQLALEMTMQEVLGNLEELALDFGYSDGDDCFEILSIEPPDLPTITTETPSCRQIRSPLVANSIALLRQKQREVA